LRELPRGTPAANLSVGCEVEAKTIRETTARLKALRWLKKRPRRKPFEG
jgi:hypothetical protein